MARKSKLSYNWIVRQRTAGKISYSEYLKALNKQLKR